MDKLDFLATAYDFKTVDDMLDAASIDSIVPGICTEPDCEFVTDVEPDQDKGHCELCNKKTVQSCLVLAGLI